MLETVIANGTIRNWHTDRYPNLGYDTFTMWLDLSEIGLPDRFNGLLREATITFKGTSGEIKALSDDLQSTETLHVTLEW